MEKNISLIFQILLIIFVLLPLIESDIPGMDSMIVVGLTVINQNFEVKSCPPGYTPASGCGSGMCDLNYDVGGNYIYLCQKKLKYKDIGKNEKPISIIRVNYNNKDCGSLNLIDSDLNKGAGGEYIYLCYGFDQEDPAPISDVFINIKENNNVPEGYTCEGSDLNKGAKSWPKWGKHEIYLCYTKNTNVPKLIEYSNIVFDSNKRTMYEIENPEKMTYIDNDNYGGTLSQTIRRTISKSIDKSYSFNFNQSLSFIETYSNTDPVPFIVSGQTLFKAQFDEDESFGYTHSSNEKEEVEFPCEALAGQHILCKAFNYNYKISIPYRMNIIYHYYDGTQITEIYKSELTGVMGSSIQFSKCCIRGCKSTDNICSQIEINNYDSLSGSCPNNFKNNQNNNYYTNIDQMVVTDITVVSSKDEDVNCPFGYEVINSGCNKEGCDLNYWAGGNYIYLCQKRQKLGFLSEEEYPINSIEILLNSKICSNPLKIINVNLNDGTGGDDINLCYGKKESSLLEPIVDFFIYIKDLNYPPYGYYCEKEMDLNSGTTKGKITYLCYTTDFSAYLLKVENENGKKIDSNLEIVTGLEVVLGKSKDTSCPYGYEVVNKGCDTHGCDLNSKSGGYYIYLCQKKQKLEQLSLNQKPINSIRIIYNKNDKKKLNLIDADLNKGSGGEYIYLTYGYDPDISASPIVDFFVHIVEINNPPEEYECDDNDLNKGAGGHYIYLCYKRNDNIPKEIVVNNIELYYNMSKNVAVGLPDKLEEIIVNSASIKKKVEKTVQEEKYLQKYFSYSFNVDVSFSLLSLMELGMNYSYTSSTAEEWKTTTTNTLSTEIECKAEERKKMMCIPFYNNYQTIIPYKAYLTYFDYKGRFLNEGEYYGNFEKISTSQISYKVCCLDGCCTGNSILDADKPQCSSGKPDILCSNIQECFYDK